VVAVRPLGVVTVWVPQGPTAAGNLAGLCTANHDPVGQSVG
jgi:hypothetical protein